MYIVLVLVMLVMDNGMMVLVISRYGDMTLMLVMMMIMVIWFHMVMVMV